MNTPDVKKRRTTWKNIQLIVKNRRYKYVYKLKTKNSVSSESTVRSENWVSRNLGRIIFYSSMRVMKNWEKIFKKYKNSTYESPCHS